MSDFITSVNDLVWSQALVYLCLAAGVFFTIRTRLLQVRSIPTMVRQLFRGEDSPSGVSSFQALTMSLAGRVGTGNIAGVATAIAFGGPGAVFWMWAVAFLGASTSFVECTLGQIYKERDADTGEYRGGPAYYFEKAFAHTRARGAARAYAVLFAAVTVVAMGLFLPGVQANGMASAVTGAVPAIETWMVALAVVILLAFIVIGGVKRIATFASIVVPFMAVLYILAALVVAVVNADQIPEVLSLIFSSALGQHAAFGAILGLAVEWGVKRGIYSNEAGQGTGPHAAAAAEVSHPAKQGYVQAFAVYIDTLFVCSATAFLILSTGMYRVYGNATEDPGQVLHEGGNLPADVAVGPGFAQAGFDTLWSGAGAMFIAISLCFFAFTTIVAYYYMAETNLKYLLRGVTNRLVRRGALLATQALILVATAVGAMGTAGDAWTLGDIGVGLMAWLNIVGILVIQQPAFRTLRDYEKQARGGLDPTFDPRALGIVGARFWEERASGRDRATDTHPDDSPVPATSV